MNKLFRLREYLRYLLQSKGIDNMHSPFVFDFMQNVLYDHRHFYAYDEIEKWRKIFSSAEKKIHVTDYGTGQSSARKLKSILRKSVKPKKHAQLFFRIINHYQSRNIIELGTSLGFTTLYFNAANKACNIITLEGDEQLALEAQKNFNALGAENIRLVTGPFEKTFEPALQQLGYADLIFFDGNHQKEATLKYFETALPCTADHSLFIFDDIYWSPGMKQAWNYIQLHERVTVTIDLYYFGIVFFRKELSKQHFMLRF